MSRRGDNAACRWFFDHLNAFPVEYDAIGVSLSVVARFDADSRK